MAYNAHSSVIAMIRKLAIAVLVCAWLVSCHRQSNLKRDQQNYEVVQEGSASGAVSTINAPGETPPPVTSTSIDTTTNFTLPGAQTQTTTAPQGSLGSTLPPPGGYVEMPAAPTPPVPGQRPGTRWVQPRPQPPYTTPSVAPP